MSDLTDGSSMNWSIPVEPRQGGQWSLCRFSRTGSVVKGDE